MLLLRAEFKKLVKSKATWVVGVLVLAFVLFVHVQTLRFQHEIALELPRLEQELNSPGSLCESPCSAGDEASIKQQLRAQIAQHARYLEVSRTALSPLAGPVVAIGLASSAVGVGLALLLIVGSLGMEFDNRTLKAVLPREPSRWRFVLAKMTSAFLLALVMVAVTASTFALANGLLADRLGPGPGARIPWSALNAPPVWILIVAPLLVLAVAVALGVIASVISRSGLGGLIGACAFLAADRLVATTSRVASPFTVSYNVWSLDKGFREWLGSQVSVSTQIWPQVFPRPEGSLAVAALFLLATTALAAGYAVLAFRRQEIA